MDLFISLYENLKKLRNGGIRMKDIAEEMDIASSVLSSLYSSVLPAYERLVSEGKEPDSALEEALLQVNNISKRKLLGCIEELYGKSRNMSCQVSAPSSRRSFWNDMEKESVRSFPQAFSYAGVYTAYSRSSYCNGMKVEPYLIAVSKEGGVPVVCYQDQEGRTACGTGMFYNGQCGYLFFNEQEKMQLTLRVVYLQMPMMEHPRQMKGVYVTTDYNQRPIARRILFVRESDEQPLDDFARRKAQVIPAGEIPDELKPYYDYTCQKGDWVRSFSLSAPGNQGQNLSLEKDVLEIL